MSRFNGFSTVELRKPLRSQFDLSHTKRLTTRMGKLTPILCLECVPSDTFRGSSEVLLRLAPLLAPIYDNIELWVHYYFVPIRLLWEEWETMITGGRLGVGSDPVTAPVLPYASIGQMLGNFQPANQGNSSLMDYLGCPDFAAVDPTPTNWLGQTIKVLPMACYQLIWFEYYRDRNFVADTHFTTPMPLPSGEFTIAEGLEQYFTLQTRNYQHDYFNSALPFTQRGQQVLIPISLGGNAPIYVEPVNAGSTVFTVDGNENPSFTPKYGVLKGTNPASPPLPAGADLYVRGQDFDGTSTNINDFRAAYAMQVWLERNAIGGSRYSESVQAHFGVKPLDMRLDRPEYIGGGRINVKISEIVSTAWSQDGGANDVPLANMGGHGVTYGNTNRFNYFCTEHGYIMGMLSIMNPPSYQQGLPRMFKRSTFLDWPWPTFAKLGEQTVNNYEIYCTPASLTAGSDGEFPIFGYQSRYADWKYMCDTNHGDFRDSLLFWTLTRTFSSPPVLGNLFNNFQDDTQNRIFAVNDVDNFWIYLHNSVSVRRALPYYGTPNTLGFS